MVFHIIGTKEELSVEDVRASTPPTKPEVAAMYQLLGVLIASGVPILEVLSIVVSCTTNNWLRVLLSRTSQEIREGDSMARGLTVGLKAIQGDNPIKAEGIDNAVNPSILVIDFGECTGELDKACFALHELIHDGPDSGLAEAAGFSPLLCSFIAKFAVMMEEGLPILRALRLIDETGEFTELSLQTTCEEIMTGATLSEALDKTPGDVKNRVFLNLVKAGECSGAMELVFKSLVRRLGK